MSQKSLLRASSALTLAVLSLLATACAAFDPAAGLPSTAEIRDPDGSRDPLAALAGSWARLPDGLLASEELRAVVDLQVRRDGPSLAALLAHPSGAVRARAAFALASVQDPAAVPALIERLADPDARVRADAAFAIGQSADSTEAPVLLEALRSERAGPVRSLLLYAIGRIGGHDALHALAAERLGPEEAADAALAIARFGMRRVHAPAATERMAAQLGSADPRARLHAAYYFGRSPDHESWQIVADRVRSSLARLDPGDPAAMFLVTGLARLSEAGDAALVAERLRSATDWRVRTNAARALASWPASEEARAALLEALVDPVPHVRVAAAGALLSAAAWSPAESAALGSALAAARDEWTRAALLPPLVAAGEEEAVLALARSGERESVELRAAALRALGAGESAAGFRALLESSSDDDARLAAAALEGLASRWRRSEDVADPAPYYRAFSAAVTRRDIATVYAASPLLAHERFRPLGSVAVLQEAYGGLSAPDDVEAMTAILAALGAAGDEAAAPLLRREAEHPQEVVRRAAAAALAAVTGQPADPPPPASVAQVEPIDWPFLAGLGPSPRLELVTEHGAFVVEFDAEQAPLTAATLLRLAREGRYDGVPFHRVVPNFVIQGGDFERGDGFGGPGFVIRSEFTRIPYRRGTAGMASAGKDTEGSQYFVAHSMQPHLDGSYTAFGVVVAGMEVVDAVRQGDAVLRARVLPTAR